VLPSEKNERLFWRICLALLILIVLYIVVWIARNVYHSLTRIHKAYDVDVGRSRGSIVEMT